MNQHETAADYRMSSERAVQQVLARYTRAADELDGSAMRELFTSDGKVKIYSFNGGNPVQLFVLTGKTEIANAISNLMRPHPERGGVITRRMIISFL